MRYLRSVGIFTIAQAAAAILAFFYALIAARLLGVVQFGLFQALMGIYGLLAAFSMPLNLATVHCVGISAPDKRRCVAGEFLRLAIYVSALCAIAVAFFSPAIMQVLRTGSVWPVLWLAALLVTTALLTTFFGILQGIQSYGQFSIAKVAHPLMTLILGSLLMLWGKQVSGAMAGYTMGMTFVLIYLFIQRDLYEWGKGFQHIRDELRSIAWIIATFGVLLLMDNAPIIFARAYLTEEQSGTFGALYSLRNVVWAFAFAVSFPLYAHLISGEKGRATVMQALILISALAIVFIAAGWICPQWLFRTLFGEPFIGAADYMVPYGFSLWLQMAAMIFMFYQVAKGMMRAFHLILPAVVLLLMLLVFKTQVTDLIVAQMISAGSYFIVAGIAFWRKRRKLPIP
ncbi:MAG: oligosaccharide flippase family protein [Candidatus Omnitrophica bacterium]|nr:oligosaccharide flippase family protein [Candidatus Omnitrophota bacterium]MDD5671842.1 oligosaccharide flippase family protein [Candidatus Omnitrophota bacterium]